LSSTEIYDPKSGIWFPAPPLAQPRDFHSAVVLTSGKVLVAGGQSNTSSATGAVIGTSSSEVLGVNSLAPAAITTVSAASFLDNGSVAPESLATAFGVNPAQVTPVELSVTVRDSTGTARQAPLLSVSPGQVNFEIPVGTVPGIARITIGSSGASANFSGNALVTRVAPGVFSANGSGQGLAAALIQRMKADGTQSYEPVARFDAAQNQFVPVPVDLGSDDDAAVLLLFGTGIRFRSDVSAVLAKIGTARVSATFAGASPQFPGVDQVNLVLPHSLAGSGTVRVSLDVDGFIANTVELNIR
jgi:uncharacterized protein (TIGR03437 family)